jgi:hypothetical protein
MERLGLGGSSDYTRTLAAYPRPAIHPHAQVGVKLKNPARGIRWASWTLSPADDAQQR